MRETETRLSVKYLQRRSILANSRAEGHVLSLFVPGYYAVKVGSTVWLDVTFGVSELKFSLCGQVKFSRREGAGPRQDGGVGLTFEGDFKREAAQMLANCAGRPVELGTAMVPRVNLQARCVVRGAGGTLKAEVCDLSSTGAFVASNRVPWLRAAEEVTLQLNPLFGTFGGTTVPGKVVWVGQKNGRSGFGVRFVGTTAELKSRLKHLLA
jgi:Tfp pilus assembly protein PilZ